MVILVICQNHLELSKSATIYKIIYFIIVSKMTESEIHFDHFDLDHFDHKKMSTLNCIFL